MAVAPVVYINHYISLPKLQSEDLLSSQDHSPVSSSKGKSRATFLLDTNHHAHRDLSLHHKEEAT